MPFMLFFLTCGRVELNADPDSSGELRGPHEGHHAAGVTWTDLKDNSKVIDCSNKMGITLLLINLFPRLVRIRSIVQLVLSSLRTNLTSLSHLHALPDREPGGHVVGLGRHHRRGHQRRRRSRRRSRACKRKCSFKHWCFF